MKRDKEYIIKFYYAAKFNIQKCLAIGLLFGGGGYYAKVVQDFGKSKF